jgi:hypothetical protein
MEQADNICLHSDGLPWWLFDMRPQGYLGRAYASRFSTELGLPANPEEDMIPMLSGLCWLMGTMR